MATILNHVFKTIGPKNYLNAAKEVAKYVRAQEKHDEDGMFWVATDDNDPVHGHIDMYHGSAGIILFFLQLADAAKDPTYLDDARRGGEFIVNKLNKYGIDYMNARKISLPQYMEGVRWTYLGGGICGVAYALCELDRAMPTKAFHDKAIELTEEVVAHAVPTNGGLKWSGKAGISFDAGTVCYLLYAAKLFNRPEWIETAKQAGDAIMLTGTKEATGGTRYRGEVSVVAMMAKSDDPSYDVPNFFYGTSGIAYMFARLYQETGDQKYLDAAKAGAEYVMGVAVVEGDAALVPYRLPDKKDIFYLSTCHGVAGTGKLFYLLAELTGEELYRKWLGMLANGVLEAGAPEMHSPGYWHSVSICCGTAGIANFFAGVYLGTKDEKYLEAAKRCGDVMISEAEYSSEGGISWYQAFHRVVPDDITEEPGYFSGASGIGAALAQVYLAEQGEAPCLRQPDEPYICKEY